MNLIGSEMYQWMTDLFPICRSITGEGMRESLAYFKKILPNLKVFEVPSGTQAFDWTVPDEWNVRDAYVADEQGQRIIDFKKNNLHLMGYSIPMNEKMDLVDLQKNLHSLPNQPDAIPYVTSYYQRRWGFCISENERQKLSEGKYHVYIDSTLEPGHLTYGELIIPGETEQEILLSTYLCHPSMANNELSGPCVTTALAKWISTELVQRRYTYRILFLPETIGPIVYLSKHLHEMKKKIEAGFVISCIGDTHAYSYLESRRGNTLADKVAKHVLNHHAPDHKSYSFLKRGSDERQYCSPGVDLPVCSIMRSKYHEYPEYHTSLDNLSFVSPEGLEGGYTILKKCIEILEKNRKYRSKVLCEPQLGKYGLYPMQSTKDSHAKIIRLINLISYSDGDHDLIDIAEKIGEYAGDLAPLASDLVNKNLFEEVVF